MLVLSTGGGESLATPLLPTVLPSQPQAETHRHTPHQLPDCPTGTASTRHALGLTVLRKMTTDQFGSSWVLMSPVLQISRPGRISPVSAFSGVVIHYSVYIQNIRQRIEWQSVDMITCRVQHYRGLRPSWCQLPGQVQAPPNVLYCILAALSYPSQLLIGGGLIDLLPSWGGETNRKVGQFSGQESGQAKSQEKGNWL